MKKTESSLRVGLGTLSAHDQPEPHQYTIYGSGVTSHLFLWGKRPFSGFIIVNRKTVTHTAVIILGAGGVLMNN